MIIIIIKLKPQFVLEYINVSRKYNVSRSSECFPSRRYDIFFNYGPTSKGVTYTVLRRRRRRRAYFEIVLSGARRRPLS